MWLPEINVFKSREMREIGKGGEHEEIQSSDGDFLGFLMSPWDMFCTDLLSHGLELSKQCHHLPFRKEFRLYFFGNKHYAHP